MGIIINFTAALNSDFLFLYVQASLPQVPAQIPREHSQRLTNGPLSVGQFLTLVRAPFPITSSSRKHFFGLICAAKYIKVQNKTKKRGKASSEFQGPSSAHGASLRDPAWCEDSQAPFCWAQASNATSAICFFCPLV